MKTWLLASRPKTLTAAVAPILASSAWVYSLNATHNWHVAIYALLASLFIQVGTNLFNDAIDFKKGADTAERLGPKRMTAEGAVNYRQMMLAGVLCLALAVFCGLPLVLRGGWPILLIGIVSLLLAYAYTGGPFPWRIEDWAIYLLFSFLD